MTKIIAFADIHGNSHNLVELIPMIEKADVALFLGDGIGTLEVLPNNVNKKIFAVRGNCDFFCNSVPTEMLLEIEDKKVLISHGHIYGVKDGIDRIWHAAGEHEADIVLYGHAHVFRDNTRSGVRLVAVSPIGTTRTGEGGSYVELMLEKGKEAVVSQKFLKK